MVLLKDAHTDPIFSLVIFSLLIYIESLRILLDLICQEYLQFFVPLISSLRVFQHSLY